jgi:hypothetical protein
MRQYPADSVNKKLARSPSVLCRLTRAIAQSYLALKMRDTMAIKSGNRGKWRSEDLIAAEICNVLVLHNTN